MSAAIAFNRGLKSLAGDEEVVAGVGETSVLGGAWAEVDGRNKDLRELFKWVGGWGVGRSLRGCLCFIRLCPCRRGANAVRTCGVKLHLSGRPACLPALHPARSLHNAGVTIQHTVAFLLTRLPTRQQQ